MQVDTGIFYKILCKYVTKLILLGEQNSTALSYAIKGHNSTTNKFITPILSTIRKRMGRLKKVKRWIFVPPRVLLDKKKYIKLLLNPNFEMTLHSTLLMNLRAQSWIFLKKFYFKSEKN